MLLIWRRLVLTSVAMLLVTACQTTGSGDDAGTQIVREEVPESRTQALLDSQPVRRLVIESALCIERLRGLQQAVKSCTWMLDNAPLDPRQKGAVHFVRGTWRGALTDFEGALEDMDRANELGIQNVQLYTSRGYTKLRLDQPEAALIDSLTALDRDPDYPEAHRVHGMALLELGELERGVAAMDRAISAKPDDGEAFALRGVALMGLRRFEDAAQDLDVAVAQGEDTIPIRRAKAFAHHYARQFARAIPEFDRVVAAGEGSPEVYVSRGTAHGETGNVDLARRDFRAAIEVGTPDKIGSTLNGIAWAYATARKPLRDPVEGRDFARQAVAAEPTNGQFIDTLAATYVAERRFDEAMIHYGRALDVDAETVAPLYKDYLKARGLYDGAIDGKDSAALRRAIEAYIRSGCAMTDEDCGVAARAISS